MKIPTPQQQAVLDSKFRIRVVRAAPGSGKTTLVAMLIEQALVGWTGAKGAIAALSFTRVGGQEIRGGLGHDLPHPHFIGTIDAFLFRYVIRPFLKKVYPNWALPRLIPAESSPKHWRQGPNGAGWVHRGRGGSTARSYNLFELCFIDEDAAGPVLGYPPQFGYGGVESVSPADRSALYAAKQQKWKSLGWLTHSDTAFLASELLAHPTHGQTIRRIVLGRFPLLIVDELQDTGFFLSKSLRLLLLEPHARGVLVGDPNQAIYEFNGARPALFDDFERIVGAVTLPLGRSQRCRPRIVTAACLVKESNDLFLPVETGDSRAFLTRYNDMLPDISRLVGSIRSKNASAELKVIARATKTVDELSTRYVKEADSLHCPALHHVYRAVRAFRQGRAVRGLAGMRAALDLSVFEHEGVTDDQLNQHGIDPGAWKQLAIRILLQCNALKTTATVLEWQSAAGHLLDQAVITFQLPTNVSFTPNSLKPQKRNQWDKPVAEFFPAQIVSHSPLASVPVQTIHSVKGETHDITVFVVPDSSKPARCPSTLWWSGDPKHLEERRIAYVAMTRTRGDLVVCVSETCYQRLSANRPAFVGAFECHTIDSLVTVF
jgi:DNA helicase-2/ATP-dependent DNA helicase PcrA